ncbi:MAG: D-glycero-beta-D-manno-heptose-7-phosphate kinase [Candidatus Aegiribacteria sp.]|nr:D-glycero-beta-D-manno-heptose-7-phosphate kinase [Candidatus Aegiribacteria sp.]
MIPDNNIENILKRMQGKRVLVAGDLILDHYLDGKVDRISPEAPIPIVSLERKHERWVLGGAANVARNIRSLGGIPVMAGVTGEDKEGEILKRLLLDEGVDVSAVVSDPARPTTLKTRIISGGHQVIRLDSEVTDPISESVMQDILSRIEGTVSQMDAVVLEDYNKGVLVPELISRIISASKSRGIPVAVDPKFINFFKFSGCTLFKPNRLEISRALSRVVNTVEEAGNAGNEILNRLSADAVLVTLGEEGSILCRKDRDPFYRPVAARHVFDVSGAGDTVIAVMALSLASGLPLDDGVRISIFAAAATCAEPGVYAVKPNDILREVDRYSR